jgi:hypothetical protein
METGGIGMNDSTLFRDIFLLQLMEVLKPLLVVLAACVLFYSAVYVLLETLNRRVEPVACEQPDESEFRQWYNDLLAQDDFSEDEARILYRIIDHADLHTAEEITTVEPDGLL